MAASNLQRGDALLELSELIQAFQLVDTSCPDHEERFAMLSEQEVVYEVADYAAKPDTPFTTSWRRRICEWLFQVADAYNFSRETVAIAMSYLDRYLCTTTVNKKFFQLASMCAFFLATKMQESRPVKMSDLIVLSRGIFKQQDLRSMEKVMLRQLKWHINPPTPGSFVRLFLHYLNPGSDLILKSVLEVTEWNTELSVVEYYFLRYKPSVIAMSSILNAFLKAPNPPSESSQLNFIENVTKKLKFDVKTEEIQKCRRALMKMYNASRISEDLAATEVVNANNQLVSPKGNNSNLRVVSPTVQDAAAPHKFTNKSVPNEKVDRRSVGAEGEEHDDLDDEVAGINAGIIVADAAAAAARPVSRCSSRLSRGGSRMGGYERTLAQADATKGSEININIGEDNRSFRVSSRSRPNSSCSNDPVRRPHSVGCLAAEDLSDLSKNRTREDVRRTRPRPASCDTFNELQEAKKVRTRRSSASSFDDLKRNVTGQKRSRQFV